MKLYTKKLIAVVIIFIATSGYSQTTWTDGNGTGVWSDPLNWSTSLVPGPGDDVIFDGAFNFNCLIDQQADCNNLTINGGYTGIIDGNGNAVIVANDFSQADGTIDANNGAFQVTGITTLSGGTFDVNSSTTDFTGNFTMTGGTFNSSTGILTFAGTFDQSGGTFNGNTGNLSFTGVVTISGTATFNGGSSTIFLASDYTITGGTFNSTSGTLTTQGNNFSRTAGTFNANGGTILVERASTTTFVITGAFTFNVLTFSSTGGISTKVIDMGTLSTAATVNLSGGAHGYRYLGNIAITSNLNINGANTGTPAPNTGTFTFTGAGPFTITGAAAAARNKLGNITMNNTGSVTMSGHISLVGSWNCTAGIGSFVSGSSTLNFYGALGNINAGTSATTRAYLDNLTINAGATLNVTTGSYVDLSGNFTKTGTGVFTGNTTLFLFTGANPHTIGGTATSNTAFNAIQKSGTGALTIGTVSQRITLADSLRITGGAVTATNFRLLSTSSLKGRVAEISGGGSLGGTMSVETFILGGLTDWAVLGGSGVSGLTFNSWYGTIPMAIEGSTTGVTSAGGQYFESVWGWNEASAFGYDSTVVVTDPINTGEGYWVFVGNGLASTTNITTTVSGTPITGGQALGITSSAQAGFNLVANPFASPISWDRIFADPSNTDVNGTIYVYNADLGTTTSYNAVTQTSSHGSGVKSGIAMGQGFYVESNQAAGTLNINEDHKVAQNTAANQLLKTNSVSSSAAARLRLKIDGGGFGDESVICFLPSATTGFDNKYDGWKLYSSPGYAGYGKGPWTIRTSISTLSGNDDYSINSLPLPLTANAVIPVLAKVYASGQHTISAYDINLPSGTCVTLKDKLLNVTHNLAASPYVAYLSDTATTARFELTVCASIAMGVNTAPIVNESVFVKNDANGVYVDLNFEKNTKAIISANNILGQEIMSPKEVECTSGKYYLDLNAKEQIIMVSVIANDKRTTKKIFVENNR